MVISVTALAFAVTSGAFGQPRPGIYLLPYGCVDPSTRVRPVAISMGCDGGQTLEAIKWTAWKPSGAIGRGTSLENTCTPACAAGHFIRNRIAIRLIGSRLCHGVREYTRISYTYVGEHLDGITPSDARKTWGEDLGCQ